MSALIHDGAAVEIFPGIAFVDGAGIQRPGNWLDLSSSEERASAGVLDIVEPPAAPDGKVVHVIGLGVVEGRPTRTYTVVDAPPPNMPVLRREAFTAAMAFGNGITGQITGAYADAEARSWTVQEEEARAVLAGGTLADGAMLPHLAADKGVALADYAAGVVAKADAFRQIAVAAVRLRRGAETLLSPKLDTPEKLAAAVEALRGEALKAAEALGLTV